MCGINGIVHFDNIQVKQESVKTMMSIQKHRGPNDEGLFCEDRIGLGFVRLSIIDLTQAGHQPMLSSDGQYVIVFNGEIFNYIELREELRKIGHVFSTNSDTEVLLAAYLHWGKECLHRLNGMWAFAIYCRKRKVLFAARDRYGIKPFYYHQNSKFFSFASEIPPLLSIMPLESPSPDYHSIFEYLVFNRTDQTDRTFFSEIKKLPHGHYLEVIGDHVNITKWYDLCDEVKKAEPFSSPEQFKDLLSDSIRLRLRSDVPVGVCFSGGLDSSTVLSILLDQNSNSDLNTFSAVYNHGEYGDEREFINEYRKALRNMHFTNPSPEGLLSDIHTLLKTHAEPFPTTGIYAQYKVMEKAKDHVVVTLDGQGADELLAGYHYFFGYFFKELIGKGRIYKLLKELYFYLRMHKSIYGITVLFYFLLPSLVKTKAQAINRGYFDKDFLRTYSIKNTLANKLYNSKTLQKAQINHFEYKLEHLLKWEDRNSMHFSLEARVPFLDHRLVARMLSTKSDFHIRNGTTKYILREAMKDLLPEKIRMRSEKLGFDTPQDEWFRIPAVKSWLREIIDSESFESRGIWNPEKFTVLFQKHQNRKISIGTDIWKCIILELWFREYIDSRRTN